MSTNATGKMVLLDLLSVGLQPTCNLFKKKKKNLQSSIKGKATKRGLSVLHNVLFFEGWTFGWSPAENFWNGAPRNS